MKVLVFGISQCLGGVESFIINYCKAIYECDSSIQFDFLVIDDIPTFALPLKELGGSFRIVPNRISHPVRFKKEIKELLEKESYDCIWYNICTLSDITLLKEAEDLVPTKIVHSHNSENMGNALNLLLHNLHKRKIGDIANVFLACSQEASYFMYPPAINSKIMPNAIDIDKFRYRAKAREQVREKMGWSDSTVIMNVGRLHRQKNPLFALDVFSEIEKTIPSAKMVFVGEGSLRGTLEKTIASRQLSQKVELLGSREDANELLMAADAFLFPSVFEGFGIAFLEAQASGLPAVVSDAVPEIAFITDGNISCSLEEPASSWAHAVVQAVKWDSSDRTAGAAKIREAGYDINACAKEFAHLLSSFKSDNRP